MYFLIYFALWPVFLTLLVAYFIIFGLFRQPAVRWGCGVWWGSFFMLSTIILLPGWIDGLSILPGAKDFFLYLSKRVHGNPLLSFPLLFFSYSFFLGLMAALLSYFLTNGHNAEQPQR